MIDILSRCPQDVETHIEVVAMKSSDEDVLVGDYATFLQARIAN
jgi:hypothetical protein